MSEVREEEALTCIALGYTQEEKQNLRRHPSSTSTGQDDSVSLYLSSLSLSPLLLTMMESLSWLAPCSSATAATTASCSSGRSRAPTSASEVVEMVAIMMWWSSYLSSSVSPGTVALWWG